MFGSLLVTSMLLAVSLADTDPVVAMCGNRCSDWETLQNQCVKDKGCWDLNGGVYDKTTENCLSKCWHVSLPCYDACSIAYETCEKQCPLGQKPDCFFSCYDNTFKEIKPTLPTK